jgi:hypothetical protein
MFGIASSLGFFPIPFKTRAPKPRGIANYDDEEESAEEDIDESVLDHAPNWSNGLAADKRDGLRAATKSEKTAEVTEKAAWEDGTEECKLILVVRTDLGMTKGSLFPRPSLHLKLIVVRQNRCPMRSCYARLLQEVETINPKTLGKDRAS